MNAQVKLTIPTPRWSVPLSAAAMPNGGPVRYRGAYGGRGSGKSHEMAGKAVEEMVADPSCSVVCIREVQKSLTLSAKKLIEAKIQEFGVGHLFDVQASVIKRIGSTGLCIFQGMQDHTADSVKSLEGFRIAWVEEAQSLSQRSLDLLRPTIRAEGSEIWFSWNPRRRGDPIEKLLRGPKGPRPDAIVVKANYTDNPFLPDTLRREAASDLEMNPEGFPHTWLGDYENLGSKVVIPASWFRSAVGLAEKLKIETTGLTYAGLDIAGGEDGGDENALAIRQGIALRSVETWNGLDTSLTTQKATRLVTSAGVQDGFYDSIGVGEGVTGEWASMGRRGEQPRGLKWHAWAGSAAVLNPDKRIEPSNPQSPTNKDQYQNMKAQAWFGLRKRFENAHKAATGRDYDADVLISIPADLPGLMQLEEEMTQPQHRTSQTGKTMVDKQPDGSRSPNMADAVVMAFWPCVGSSLNYAGAL